MIVTVIADRSFKSRQTLCEAIDKSGFEISEIVAGSLNKIDSLVIKWADSHNIPRTIIEADWKDLNAPNAIIKEGQHGKYNCRAHLDMYEKIADYAEGIIVINSGEDTEYLVNLVADKCHYFEYEG